MKKILNTIIVSVLCILFSGCTDGNSFGDNYMVGISVPVAEITLNKTILSLSKGNSETLIATILPKEANDPRVTWTSSNTSVATVDSNGKVTAVADGTTTIMVTSVSNGIKSATCVLSVVDANNHNYVDLGLTSGLLWATCNVGASSPSDYGYYYAWGETTTKSEYTSSNYTYSDSPTTLPLANDAANANWGGSWRMPTKEEFQELYDECTWTWTTLNGKNCYKVSSKKNSAYLFLPAAGDFNYSLIDEMEFLGPYGNYWSSSLSSSFPSTSAYYLDFYSSSVHPSIGVSSYYRYYGRSVRPVLK